MFRPFWKLPSSSCVMPPHPCTYAQATDTVHDWLDSMKCVTGEAIPYGTPFPKRLPERLAPVYSSFHTALFIGQRCSRSTILHHSAPPCFTRFASHHSSSHAVDTSVVYMGDAISGVVRMGDDGRSGLGHANSEAVRTGDNSALVHPNSVIGITVPWYEYPRTGTQFTICQYHAQVCQVYMLR